MIVPEVKDRILAQLKQHNAYNPIYSAALELLFEMPGSTLRDYIRELRREAEPIVMSNEGYYYEDSYEAIEKTVLNLESRAKSMLKTSNMLRRRYNKGQLKLTFES